MKITILSVGGTFDKVYHDALSDYQIGDPQISEMLEQAKVGFAYTVEALIAKDSLDMTDADRQQICERVQTDPHQHMVITHGTDTMIDTARALSTVVEKTIVLTGSMQPARFRNTDAHFNAGFALAAAQFLPAGVYIAMNGEIFTPAEVAKNRSEGRFEKLPL